MPITIDRAIKNLETESEDTFMGSEEEWKATILISKEGLKRLQDMRISPCTTADEILPGETEE